MIASFKMIKHACLSLNQPVFQAITTSSEEVYIKSSFGTFLEGFYQSFIRHGPGRH